MKKLLASVAIVLCTAFGLSAPSAAQTYPPTLSVVVIVSDGTVIVIITGCQTGENVSVVVTNSSGTVIVSITIACNSGGGGTSRPSQTSGGTATGSFTTPTAPGTYTVTATGQTSGFVGSTTFTVSATQATTTTTAAGGGALPTTGSDNTPTLWIAASTVLVGAGLAAVAWRRRRPAAAS